MAAITLVGTAVMGVFLLVVVLALARGMDWRSNEIFEPGEAGSIPEALAGSPVVWVLVFLVLALGSTGVALAAVGGFGLSLPGGTAVALAPFGLILFGFLVAGTYAAVRDRNVSPAGATLVAAILLASLLVVAITVHLLAGP